MVWFQKSAVNVENLVLCNLEAPSPAGAAFGSGSVWIFATSMWYLLIDFEYPRTDHKYGI